MERVQGSGFTVAPSCEPVESWLLTSRSSSRTLDGSSRKLTVRRGDAVLIDEILPEYDFSERHSTNVEAAPERVYEIARRLDELLPCVSSPALHLALSPICLIIVKQMT